MKQIFDQFLHFLQQGITAIFRFVQLVWTWSIDQITKMAHVPWENWPLWKQILFFIIMAGRSLCLVHRRQATLGGGRKSIGRLCQLPRRFGRHASYDIGRGVHRAGR